MPSKKIHLPRHHRKEIWFLTSELEGERASSFRQTRWCNIFLEAGAKLRIFNLRGAFNHSDVICNDASSLADFRKTAIAAYRGPQTSVREGALVQVLRTLKHFLLADLYLPSVFKLYFRLNTLAHSLQEPVVVMASSPPFSVALVGALIKHRHPDRIILAVDMRDAWALHTALGGIKFIKRFIERKVLRRADWVSTVSHGLAEEFSQRYGIEVDVMYNVATHYLDSPLPERIDLRSINPMIDPARITLVYTGSTPENFYDVRSLIAAYTRLHSEQIELAQKLQLIFVGACEPVQREAKALNVAPSDIVFVNHLPQATARKLQASASALIFLAYHGPKNMGVVSTKLFEYLCLGQPIAPFDLCKGSDVDMLLYRYCEKSINAHGENEMFELLDKIAREGLSVLPRLEDANRVRELVNDYRNHAENLLAT